MKIKLQILPKAKYVLILLLLAAPLLGWSQKRQRKPKTAMELIEDTTQRVDVIDIVKSKFQFKPKSIKRSPGKKVYFSLLPVSSAIPGGGRALITSTSAGFYLGSRRNTFYPTLHSLHISTLKAAIRYLSGRILYKS